MAKGLYAGLDLEGSVVKVRDSLNTAYCDKDLRPADIIVKKDCSNAKNGPAFFSLSVLLTRLRTILFS